MEHLLHLGVPFWILINWVSEKVQPAEHKSFGQEAIFAQSVLRHIFRYNL